MATFPTSTSSQRGKLEPRESPATALRRELVEEMRAFDYILDYCNESLSIRFIKRVHFLLKQNTADVDNPLTLIGEFKKVGNVIGGINFMTTTKPHNVEKN